VTAAIFAYISEFKLVLRCQTDPTRHPTVWHKWVVRRIFYIWRHFLCRSHWFLAMFVYITWLWRRFFPQFQALLQVCTWQHTTLTTDKHPCPRGIGIHNVSRRAAADLHLRTRGQNDRLPANNGHTISSYVCDFLCSTNILILPVETEGIQFFWIIILSCMLPPRYSKRFLY